MIQHLILSCFLIFPLMVSSKPTSPSPLQPTSPTPLQPTTTDTSNSKHHNFIKGQRDGAWAVAGTLGMLLLVGVLFWLHIWLHERSRSSVSVEQGPSPGVDSPPSYEEVADPENMGQPPTYSDCAKEDLSWALPPVDTIESNL